MRFNGVSRVFCVFSDSYLCSILDLCCGTLCFGLSNSWTSLINTSDSSGAVYLYTPQWPNLPDTRRRAGASLAPFSPPPCSLTVVRVTKRDPLFSDAGFDTALSKQISSLSFLIPRTAGKKQRYKGKRCVFIVRQGTPVIICEVKKIRLHSQRGISGLFSSSRLFSSRLFSQVLRSRRGSAEASGGVCGSPSSMFCHVLARPAHTQSCWTNRRRSVNSVLGG